MTVETDRAARRFEADSRALRLPSQAFGFGFEGEPSDSPARFSSRESGDFWDLLGRLGVQLLVTREYEHLLVSLRAAGGKGEVSYLPIPHPSGLVFDSTRACVTIAATRNPNQLFTLERVESPTAGWSWMPRSSRILPGAMYLHDLAYVGGALHANAVGQNCVVRIDDDGSWRRVWWPASVGGPSGPDTSRNHLQLNSIAGGPRLEDSYFSASCASPGRYPPGHQRFAVDKQGVIFAGDTRAVCADGLTRPHSARFFGDQLWVDNSGYGEVGRIEQGAFEPVFQLDGWTRGLCVVAGYAFAGTSRVLPRFSHYAPGVQKAICGIHALDLRTGQRVGSLQWPAGNQVFAIEAVPEGLSAPLPYTLNPVRGRARRAQQLFYEDNEGR